MNWISVKERLPEEGKLSLVYDNYSKDVALAYREEDDWLDCSIELYEGQEDITHWMELPAPPERELSIKGKLKEFIDDHMSGDNFPKWFYQLKELIEQLPGDEYE